MSRWTCTLLYCLLAQNVDTRLRLNEVPPINSKAGRVWQSLFRVRGQQQVTLERGARCQAPNRPWEVFMLCTSACGCNRGHLWTEVRAWLRQNLPQLFTVLPVETWPVLQVIFFYHRLFWVPFLRKKLKNTSSKMYIMSSQHFMLR